MDAEKVSAAHQRNSQTKSPHPGNLDEIVAPHRCAPTSLTQSDSSGILISVGIIPGSDALGWVLFGLVDRKRLMLQSQVISLGIRLGKGFGRGVTLATIKWDDMNCSKCQLSI